MTWKMQWLLEPDVIFVDGGTIMTREDALALNDHLKRYMDESKSEQVHIVYDTRRLTQYPVNILWLRDNITIAKHNKYGHNITISDNAVLRYLGGVVHKVQGYNLPHLVSDYEQARTLLVQLDPTTSRLPDQIPL